MAKPPKVTNLEQLIAILNDRQWHSADELAEKVTWRFGSIVHDALRKGYLIETRKVANNQSEYRLSCKTLSLENFKALSPQLLERIPYLKMLVLFGSRATGKTHTNSDWDFAALYDEKSREKSCQNRGFAWFEVPGIIGQVFSLNSDEIDVVELDRASPLIAHFVARDGKLLYEKEPGEFDKFKQKALMSDVEIQTLSRNLRQGIDEFLKEWGLV